MSFDLRTLPATYASDTDFRNWASALHAQFAAMGFVQTSDSGQINLATVTLPGAGAVGGYEVWRFNDSLQSSFPVFFKIEYGIPLGANFPGIWITTGTGSNGSGTLTGQVGARKFTVANSYASGNASYMCSDGSGFALVFNFLTTNISAAGMVIVERTRDGSGNATADGIYTFSGVASGTQSNWVQMIPPTGAVPAGAAIAGVENATITPGQWVTTMSFMPAVVGGNVPLAPLACVCGKFCFLKLAHLVQLTQITNASSFSATIFGATHTLMPLAIHGNAAPAGEAGASPTNAICLLWE